MSFCLLKTLTDGLEWCGLLVVMFLSAVWTLILTAHIHCRGSIGEQVMEWYISPNLMKKLTHLYLGYPEGEHIFSKFIFGWTIPLTVIASTVLCFTADGRNACHLTYLIFENLWDDHRHFMFRSSLKCMKSRQGNSLLHLTSSSVQKYKSIASSKIIVNKTNETWSSYQDPLWSLKD